MENSKFKLLFGKICKENNFQKAHTGWYIENEDTILVLELQKSNFSELYFLNIKIYIQMLWGKKYQIDKRLIKIEIGDIFFRVPNEYQEIFDLENNVDDITREKHLNLLFKDYLNPIAKQIQNINGLIEFTKSCKEYILPNVKDAIEKLHDASRSLF